MMILLKGILDAAKNNFPTGLSDDEVFELYCADNLLINYDLDLNSIEAGIIDGPRDAGIDAAYIFINQLLVNDDFNYSSIRQPPELELIIIQAKNQDSFKEGVIDKLSSSLPLLLNYNQKKADLEPLFKKEVVTICRQFIDITSKLADKFPKISIRIYYCTTGTEPNDTIKAKAAGLEKTIASLLGIAPSAVAITFFGGQQLYDRSRTQKRLVAKLIPSGTPLSSGNAYVALCRLPDYLKFISDENGNLMMRMFEANVRAYQGEVAVNREIAESIADHASSVDFWWMNNGVTIVADEATFINGQLNIANPLIVNGLQTSNEIHANGISENDQRGILIRVIQENDPVKRDKIIRATNRQTKITDSSFRASEPVHAEIEQYFLTLGYYYDRRKSAHKRDGKPAAKIISIDRLAQAALSVLIQEPHVARGRPTTIIKKDADYKKMFSGDKAIHPLEMYGVILKMLIGVEHYFRTLIDPEQRAYRYNMKFHTLMVLSWALNGSTNLPALAIPNLDLKKMTTEQIKAVTDWVFSEFKAMGAEDKIAKRTALTERLKANWKISDTLPKQEDIPLTLELAN